MIRVRSSWLVQGLVSLVAASGISATVVARAEPVETEIPGVSAELLELRQQGGVLRLAIRFVNGSDAAPPSQPIPFSDVTLVDAKSKKKHFVVQDADGQYLGAPITDRVNGGRWFVEIAPRSQAVLWAYFEPLPAGTKVSVQLPGMFPFDDTLVTEGPGALLSSTQAVSELPGWKATLVSAKRADEQLAVRLKLTAADAGASRSGPVTYARVFAFDPRSKRKYPVLKDAEGMYQAQPLEDRVEGGRFFPANMAPGGSALMSLALQAPPDDVAAVDLVIPGLLPIEGVAVAGLGGASTGGIAAGGKSLGLEGALKELKAEVTPQEIKINLSADVLFDFDKAELKPAAEGQLQNLLTVVREKASSSVSVTGHTDLRGSDTYNQELSERRAQAVKTWLLAHGVAAERVAATGAGEAQPLRLGDTEGDHQTNRRVEIRIRG